jgi:hypothetical protein
VRKLRQIKTWVSDIKCTSCGKTTTIYHGGETNRDKALKDKPTYDKKIKGSGLYGSWFIGKNGKELCPECTCRLWDSLYSR